MVKPGRKKSPTIQKLENTIEKLKSQLEKTKIEHEKEKELTLPAIGVIKRDREYYIVYLKYNHDSKKAIVVETKLVADSVARLIYELKKAMMELTKDLVR